MSATSFKGTFFWHDYETFGKDPRWASACQFAGIRTDAELNVVGEPVSLFCQPPRDVLPDPEACLVTGITPQQCQQEGLPEYLFARQVAAELGKPGTCGVGFNSIRFDDEFTRHLLYRNFYDPYEREWKHGNSRWDILDVLRFMHALRPEGIEWPRDSDGRNVFRLQELTRANRLEHEHAHDALSDVKATIAVARLVRQAQPRLFEYALGLRDKREVGRWIDLASHKPVFHVSSRLSPERSYSGLMMPVCKDPSNNNGVVCYDLSVDPQALLACSAEEISERVFTRQDQLPAGVTRIPLKTIHLNRSPMLAAANVLDAATASRLKIDVAECEKHWHLILADIGAVVDKVTTVMSGQQAQAISGPAASDPEFMLYRGFISPADRQLCEQVKRSNGAQLAQSSFPFTDKRLQELLLRYRARNFLDTLDEEECHLWEEFRFDRLNQKWCDGYFDLETYHSKIAELLAKPETDRAQRALLVKLQEWADEIL